MAFRIGIVGIAFASGMSGWGLADVRAARADEAFLCGPDTVVYVKSAELELKKRTDPCIAAYFGLQIGGSPSPGTQPPETKPSDKSAGSDGLQPARSGDVAAPQPLASSPFELKRLPSPEQETPARPAEERSASLARVVAAPGADFRNVHVINPSSPDEEWYRHVR